MKQICKACNQLKKSCAKGFCQVCYKRNYRKINKEKLKKTKQEYYQSHKKEWREHNKQWKLKNPERNKELKREQIRKYRSKEKNQIKIFARTTISKTISS